ncbi:MAG TPA: HAD family hydrolase [Vicinamibacterales bacterium]|nr:HAD family hydrolase [Vicinamibacterales bacterium]
MNARAVFIDRDGTLIREAGYLNEFERLELFPYTVDAVRQLNRAGLVVVVITNQAGIARGIVSDDFVARAHARISETLAAGGAHVDRYYHCPHHPRGVVPELSIRCECRKPAPGLWREAARDLSLDLARSYSIGDRWRDVQAARTAGTAAVMVRTGYGSREESAPPPGVSADAIVDNLAAAAGWILEQEAHRQPTR